MHIRLSRAFIVVLLAWGSGGVTGCSSIDEVHRCNDGIDNDFDGLVDIQDPGCEFNGREETPDPVECNDGVDNDGDALIDLDDPGCSSDQDRSEAHVPDPGCSDGIDNDGDGRTDYPNDPGCFLPLEDDEGKDDCTAEQPENCPACANGKDDDGDGNVDYPADPGCASAGSFNEFDLDPNACGGDLTVELFPALGEAVGSVSSSGYNAMESSECGGAGPEKAWAVQIPDPATLLISTASSTTTADTVIYLRRDCTDTTTEIACNDNANPFVESSQLLIDATEPGVYYLIVDSTGEGGAGGFRVSISSYTLTGTECDPVVPNCAPGQTCRTIDDAGTETYCLPSQCSDSYDNDGDGFLDYPDDPGCRSTTDITEADDCPDGTNCPQCANGIDDDYDGRVDFPQDGGGCDSASDDEEIDECLPGLLPAYLPVEGVTGTTPTYSAGSNFKPKCHSATSPEDVYYFPVFQDMASLTFSTVGSLDDTVLSVRYEECGNDAVEIACNHEPGSGEAVTIDDARAGIYYVFVDGDYLSSVDYVLNVSGELLAGAACDPAATQFTCASGYLCDPAGGTCVAAVCGNGVDDDSDGFVDYGEDPGCAGPGGETEVDDCPDGPGCAACSNGLDDDNDGDIDAADLGCVAPGDQNEANECIPGTTFAVLPRTGVNGSTPSSANGSDFTPSCHTSTTSTERVYAFILDSLVDTLTFTTEGSTGDTVLSVRYGVCSDAGAEIACKQDAAGGETIVLDAPAQGVYYVFVDGDNVSNINYKLRVYGTVEVGGSCDPNDAAIVCEDGYACDGTTLTCTRALCANGVDDDADGRIDYPYDPGCTAANDHDESDPCPAGPNCPECGDGIDNDTDGAIDFGSDVGCMAANDTTESNNCIPNVAFAELTAAGVTGTTPESTVGSKFSPSCHSSTSSTEDVYAFPMYEDLASLTFSTIGSTGDTVLSVRYNECGNALAELACEQINSGGESITIDEPAQGMYYVFVDGDYTSNIDYVLNVSVNRRGGAACDPADAAVGCEAGYFCDSATNTCNRSACNNGVDEDGDGLIDYPNDPGCDSTSDSDELDDCPSGPLCPVCSNELDDDTDGTIDYPSDLGCESASDPDELLCPDESDPIEPLIAGSVTGTTAGLADDFDPSCASTTSAPDKTYLLRIPGALSTLTVDTTGSKYDTTVMLRAADCTAEDYACDDDSGFGLWSRMTQHNVPAGLYFLMVDGYSNKSGEFNLKVSGIIAAGAACELSQISAGLFTCGAGTSCVDMGSGYRCQ